MSSAGRGRGRVINFLEARANLKRVLDRVGEDADYAVIVQRDGPDAVVMYTSA